MPIPPSVERDRNARLGMIADHPVERVALEAIGDQDTELLGAAGLVDPLVAKSFLGLEIGLASRDPELLGLVRSGQAPEGPGSSRVVGGGREQPLVGPGRVAGTSGFVEEFAERSPGFGDDLCDRVASPDVFQEPGVFLGLPSGEQLGGRSVELGVKPSTLVAKQAGESIGDQAIGPDLAVAVRRIDCQGSDSLISQEGLQGRDRIPRIPLGELDFGEVEA